MSAAEDDTELRDLLIQNLENCGVLNKLKAEMRAAVFLAMEDQDRQENKTPLINENLKKCLNTKDGRLMASLIMDFLQVFNLDFSLAVFQPEINSLNGLDSRDLVCRELGLSDSELNRNSPVLLELVRRGRQTDNPAVHSKGDRGGHVLKELSQKQIGHARKTFDFHDKDLSGSVRKEDLKSVFKDLLPGLDKNMLERFVDDELRAADNTEIDFQSFLAMYKRLFTQCRSVVVPDSNESRHQTQNLEDKPGSPPVSKESERVLSPLKRDLQQQDRSSVAVKREHLDLELDAEEDHDEGDSFFDDPLPKPQKTYGCSLNGEKDSSERTNSPKDVVPSRQESLSGPPISPMRRGRSHSDLSVLAGDPELERDDPVSDPGSQHRKMETSGTRESPVGSVCEPPRPGGGSSGSEPSHSRNGAKNSREKNFKAPSGRIGSLHLDEDVEYDDDFNSHRSDLSNGELSIGEEIEEVSIEGPENSDKFDETTQDLSVSHISQSHDADYMEDVS
ncbi:FGFR1 oncogene partner isoform X3 [Girardinichthys multiradiatus]|uniref:FGFR1 oncogene partner isoform X3 n=1 Tax=Girardinichthys multiradiatus TaxID=208333 RepID=UPI001FAD26ED|nr:FGFR1 oncogene partner isoform X3 [Girardinichthys multiradiatus]